MPSAVPFAVILLHIQSTERSEGISEGVSTGKILGAVETMRDDGKSNQDIVARLMVKYSLTQEQAERYVLAPVTM